jgi:hypothetical protein
MIAKVTRGASGRGLIRYLFGPGRANEHTGQRVITLGVALGGDALAGGGLSSQEVADLGSGLDEAHEAFGTDSKGGHLYHLSLSLPAGDRQLTDDQWTEIAQKTIEALGFEGHTVEPAAWVAVGHGTSINGNEHIHIAASLIRVDGSQVDIWQDRRTLSKVLAQIEHNYGLTVVQGREGEGMPGLSRAELECTARDQRAEPPRLTLARIVREASVASRDEAEFVRRLRGTGALVRPRFETGGKEAVVGYSVALRAGDGATPVWFGGGKLARDLTLPNLRQFWEQSAEDRKDAVVEWCATRSDFLGREAVLGDPGDWQRAVAGIERSVERLIAIPVSDLAAWRGAAREAAGVFSALSRRFEGDSPGPMADAADTLARSAQSRPEDPPPSRAAVRDFRGIAAIVAQSGLNNGSPMVWAMLVDQMGRTLRAIGDAHAVRGESQMAQALGERLSDEILELHERFETSSTQHLIPGEQMQDDRAAAAMHEIPKSQPRHHRRHGPNQARGIER